MLADIYKTLAKPSYLLIFSILAVFGLYYNTVVKMTESWRNEANSHGILLFIICVYLFYKIWRTKRRELVFSFTASGYILLLLLSLIWFFANVTFVQYVELVSIPIILVALLITLLGWRQSQVFWFPVLLMLFGGPILTLFIPIFQNITATMTGILLGLTGISSVVEGVLVLVPAGTFEVDSGCSGLNVVTVGSMLSLLYAYIHRYKIGQSILLLTLGIAVSLFANIIRVYTIVLIGNATQMQHPLVADHANLGWIIFLIIFGTFIFLVHRYWPVPIYHTDTPEPATSGQMKFNTQVPSNRNIVFFLILALLSAGSGPLLLSYQLNYGTENYTASSQEYAAIGEWRAINRDNPSWKPVYNAGQGDFSLSQTFVNGTGKEIHFHKRYFLLQMVDNEAINETNHVYARNAWTRVWKKYHASVAGAGVYDVEETLIRGRNNQEMLIWRWYYTNGQKTGDPYKAKFYNLLGILSGKPAITVYVIAEKVLSTYAETRSSLTEFVDAANPVIYP